MTYCVQATPEEETYTLTHIHSLKRCYDLLQFISSLPLYFSLTHIQSSKVN